MKRDKTEELIRKSITGAETNASGDAVPADKLWQRLDEEKRAEGKKISLPMLYWAAAMLLIVFVCGALLQKDNKQAVQVTKAIPKLLRVVREAPQTLKQQQIAHEVNEKVNIKEIATTRKADEQEASGLSEEEIEEELMNAEDPATYGLNTTPDATICYNVNKDEYITN